MIDASAINFVLSGSASNTDPASSLGGDPSASPLTSQLLPDVTVQQALQGFTDFHCIYITNDSSSDPLYNASVYIDNETLYGIPVALGFEFQNDIQQVSISLGTTVMGGSFVLQYEGTNFTVPWASGASAWAAAFQTAINALPNLSGVQVTGGVNGTTVVFQINFFGDASNRFHAILGVVDDSGLTPIGAGHVSVLKIFDGGPINSIAPEVDAPTTAPNGILFFTPTKDETLLLGDLRGTDIVPVWIRRDGPANFPPLAGDGFALKITGNPFPNG